MSFKFTKAFLRFTIKQSYEFFISCNSKYGILQVNMKKKCMYEIGFIYNILNYLTLFFYLQ